METKILPSIQRLISSPSKEIPLLEKDFKISLIATILLFVGGLLAIAIAALMPYDIILRAASLVVAGINFFGGYMMLQETQKKARFLREIKKAISTGSSVLNNLRAFFKGE
ncbi:MAG: hypothetical protein ACFFBD_07115 [Candidatus Hodarchaeota archaeon]